MAIAHATTILGWFEHLTEEDMPPNWMWHLSDALEEHFEKVKERRKAGTSGTDDDDDEPVGPVLQNAYARGRGRAMAVNDV